MSNKDLKINKKYKLPKKIEDEKIKLKNNINQLISDFENQTNTKVLTFIPNRRPIELGLLIDLDVIPLELR